ncbi:UDP-N-acetylmuramyl pentapeptide phosphotransferase/UDP-N-acetylglucosamine-1-phosphate transferase [Candidatus Kryptonium thompsonii]|uniref:UDP-N-acetylmuramyl pentapeptide phosphotransferase/UDP-N-acetylglucosamine-1-phosphate transferase n=1 Tax=Candidatus Kryptonium thompsonii TaxID=1633631 RepID=A0A0P1LBR6_9BACT|nr:glycosyltransferase [Candidatus Kryptonium thompsoni]CUS76745.1 UDP-N-acetylmuramyl pentapeptide phosphotransferase/UDP-N-acetylglucosamine-1-phosphate transferase [Candidatus Kryptonium thompsoni]CUS82686.1 UDP-N-acetylmuramyl pentapeptide phosphotransferase/UDP-N-acetylglucosamine-1-phosphate transferase [Candidatus Kryptonium thompsoni]CUS84001.1 UDP-N-acetylmuramyl pentapeptide phosphotransferase/UDP-N-acetylglucosamine-1-phosphate transferase [Candidatus Kryptonium thompsoni]CUS84021.1 
MLWSLVSFLVSFLLCFFIIRYGFTNNSNNSAIFDSANGEPQKFHSKPTPRIGGVAIWGGFIAASVILFFQKNELTNLFVMILLCSTPLFAIGTAEDLTKKIAPMVRFSVALVSALLSFFLMDVRITRLDIIVLDDLLRFLPLSLFITILAIAGFSNAVNLIDGFNGLASGVSMIILIGLAYVAFKVNDTFLLFLSIVIIAAVLGFFIWNYPRGLIFLGDAGAYIIGFFISVISILLVARHHQVSPWFPMLLLIYPVWETLFSIYRRKFKKGYPLTKADILHFHSLVYKRITRENSSTSIYFWGITFISFIPAVIFWQKSLILQVCTFLWIVMYLSLYRKIVHFETPKYLKYLAKQLGSNNSISPKKTRDISKTELR